MDDQMNQLIEESRRLSGMVARESYVSAPQRELFGESFVFYFQRDRWFYTQVFFMIALATFVLMLILNG